jgi:hypothetical protein
VSMALPPCKYCAETHPFSAGPEIPPFFETTQGKQTHRHVVAVDAL